MVGQEWFPKITDPITEEEEDMLDLAYGLTDTYVQHTPSTPHTPALFSSLTPSPPSHSHLPHTVTSLTLSPPSHCHLPHTVTSLTLSPPPHCHLPHTVTSLTLSPPSQCVSLCFSLCRSRLGCQVVVTEDLDGLSLTIPIATIDVRET